MGTPACPSCGHAYPTHTRAMHACPNCGRPIDIRPGTTTTQPPDWLVDPAPADPTGPIHAPEAVAASERESTTSAASERVMDLPGGGGDRDPLDGWDASEAGHAPDPISDQPDWVVAMVATLVGGLVGILASRGRGSGKRGLGGGVVGLLAAIGARRMWRIDAPDATWAAHVDASGSTGRPAPLHVDASTSP